MCVFFFFFFNLSSTDCKLSLFGNKLDGQRVELITDSQGIKLINSSTLGSFATYASAFWISLFLVLGMSSALTTLYYA